ncbi:MAG TPA: hypothetical protein VD813_00085 [Pseudonocardia sp.]|nr:hypothetical protein [Pseudonocardia sp.]
MDNDALVAALGPDAAAAVHGYRLHVLAEPRARGLAPADEALPPLVEPPGRAAAADPVEIRLVFGRTPARTELGGRLLRWVPATGWSASHGGSHTTRFLAGAGARPVCLVPLPGEVVVWAAAVPLDGHRTGPVRVELDDDPVAIRRLLAFAGPHLVVPARTATPVNLR